jgi:hypothetical protein
MSNPSCHQSPATIANSDAAIRDFLSYVSMFANRTDRRSISLVNQAAEGLLKALAQPEGDADPATRR